MIGLEVSSLLVLGKLCVGTRLALASFLSEPSVYTRYFFLPWFVGETRRSQGNHFFKLSH